MKAKNDSKSPLDTLRDLLSQPLIATALIVVYLAVTLYFLLNLNRSDLWFPLYTTLAFPPLVVAPFIIFSSTMPKVIKYIFILLLLFVAVPLIGIYDSNYLELMIQICIFASLAVGLNVVVGFAGLLDLGYVAFFAFGAYIWGMFTSSAPTIFEINGWLVPQWAFYPFLILGVVVAAVVGILLGLPVLRLRGDYLAIVTLGFGEMIRLLANNLNSPVNFTNGPQGLHDVPPPSSTALIEPVIEIGRMMGINVASPAPVAQQLLFYFLAIAILGVIIVLVQRLDNSPIGRAWTAIREDEVAAIAMGVPLVRMKLLAFASGAACAGAIGVLYAAKQSFVSPESFQLIQSINILAMVIIGGMGGIRGVLLGAAVVTLLNLQVLTNFALQVNNLRGIDYIVPSVCWQVPALIIGILGANWLYQQVRRARLDGMENTTIGSILSKPSAITVIVIIVLAVILLVLPPTLNVRDWPSQLTPDKYQRFVFGILLVVMMIFRPEGLLPEPRRKMELRHETPPSVEEETV
jgi:branched-chain amino acid transport system permease protein